MRADSPSISAPPFPRNLPWVNVATLRMDQQRGKAVLVEFWDFCRVNSLRTLPYLKAWHERYADAGLRIVGVHTGGFPPARDEANVRARGGAARDPVAGRDRHRARGLGHLRQPGLAGALPVGRRAGAATRCTTARAPTRRPSARSRRCSASSASRWRRCAPRTSPDALIAGPDRGPAGRLLRPLRGGRRVGGRRGAGELRVNGRGDRGHRARLHPARRARPPHRGELALELGAGRRRATRPASPRACASSSCPGRRAGGRAAAGRRPRRSPRCPASTASRSGSGVRKCGW